jgi:tetratricopeptide (TPR) repeat protein
VTDRLVVDFGDDGRVTVSSLLDGDLLPSTVGVPFEFASPLNADALEDLRWYLEDYLRAPFGVYSDRGTQIAERLSEWGTGLFTAIFGAGPARDAYVKVRARGRAAEVIFRSGAAQPLALPWELMRDPSLPQAIALERIAITRMLPAAQLAEPFEATGSRLRVLMVISRPQGDADVGYQMIARELLTLLPGVRGAVDLVVLRPPTLKHLEEVLAEAIAAGEPFQIVHFDGHGVFGISPVSAAVGGFGTDMFSGPIPTGMLAFEKPGGGSDLVEAERVAQILAGGRVPVVVLNACQSGQMGGQVEAAVATRLLRDGASSVVAMAYSVYAVAAAQFMAVFYERLFAGDRVTDAVAAARQRLAVANLRPSPKGKLPLADWTVPVHYTRRDVSFPGLHTDDPRQEPLSEMLDRIRTGAPGSGQNDEGLEPVGSFIGRDGLLYTLEVAARLQKVVVLYGQGGTGKTELAKGFGRWWRDTNGVDQPDWVIWHSFEPGIASFGLPGVVNGIGLRVFGSEFALLNPHQRRQAVLELLEQRRLLLIWDNFESVRSMHDPNGATPPLSEMEQSELRAFLTRIRERGSSSVIITSRTEETWLGDVRRIEVAGLNRDEAIDYADYLLEPFPHTRPQRSKRSFDELMQWLDGHPLSMRLTIPLLDTTDPQELLDGLRGVAPLPGRDDGGRTSSLSASIAYSFTHLPAEYQNRLTVVSLFHGVADASTLGIFSNLAEAPEHFRGITTDEWVKLLNQAARFGLLTPLHRGMYRIHPALPAYLTDHWRDIRADEFDQQHAAATQALLVAFVYFGRWLNRQMDSGDAQLALSLVDLQRRTLGAMLGYAFDQHLWEHAQDIAMPIIKYLHSRGLSEERQGWVDRARLVLEAPDGVPPDFSTPEGGLWMFLVSAEANQQVASGHFDDAELTYRSILHALELQLPSPGQLRNLASGYHQLGRVAEGRGYWDEAEKSYWKSFALMEELGNRSGMANSYHQLGLVAQARESWDEADGLFQQSLAIAQELGSRPAMGRSYFGLARGALERGRWDEAEKWCRQSLAIMEELGDRPAKAVGFHQLGAVAEGRGRLGEAEDWYLRSLTIEEALGNQPGIATSYAQLGYLAHLQGHLQRALEWLVRCVALFDYFPHPAIGPATWNLKLVTAGLGIDTLDHTWRRMTGNPLPDDVRRHVEAPDEPEQNEGGSQA